MIGMVMPVLTESDQDQLPANNPEKSDVQFCNLLPGSCRRTATKAYSDNILVDLLQLTDQGARNSIQ